MVFNNLTFRKILWCLLFNLTKCVFISPRIWMHWSTLANKPNYVWFNKNYLCNNNTWFDNIKISMVLDCYKFLGSFCNKSVKKQNKYQLNFAFSAGIFPYVQECLFAIAVFSLGSQGSSGSSQMTWAFQREYVQPPGRTELAEKTHDSILYCHCVGVLGPFSMSIARHLEEIWIYTEQWGVIQMVTTVT